MTPRSPVEGPRRLRATLAFAAASARAATLAFALAACASAGGADPAASRLAPFFALVRREGRAEVRIERHTFDVALGAQRLVRGRVSLEPPGRARVDFEGGESVTLRDDGGEWLQPALKQLVRLGPMRARAALGWCDLLLGPGTGGIEQRDLKDGRVLLLRGERGGPADSAWVTLDAGARPATLEFRAGEGEVERVRLRQWTIGAARGRGAFVLEAPHGFEVVDLP